MLLSKLTTAGPGVRGETLQSMAPGSTSLDVHQRRPTRRHYAWIDAGLDFLREHRMPAVLEIILSWLVAVGCLLYYGYSYFFPPPINDIHVPLMALSKDEPLRPHDLPALVAQLPTPVSDDELVRRVRSSPQLRRVVSKIMQTPSCTTLAIYPQLKRLWLRFLELPPISPSGAKFDVALIVPAFRESGIERTLRHAFRHCCNPSRVQVVVVDAGENAPWSVDQGWGSVTTVSYRGRGGRGPTLNAGSAAASEARFYTFLHSDTLLPPEWDRKVQETLSRPRIHACAFSFGHDTSQEGLQDRGYPWGIKSVHMLGNLRADYFKLPYGDHVISIPAAYFWYLGGYPSQPIMEDYEMMDVLRKRAKVMNEDIRIIPRPTALCGVRRWQKFGVVYTTLVNLLIVYRYIRGWTPREIFEYYYQRPASNESKKGS